MKISLKNLIPIAAFAILTGCATSVPMASKEQDAASKIFKAPSANMAGVYIYRINSSFAKGLTKRLSIDGIVIGETAPGVYFHREVTPGEHTVATQAEFGENTVKFKAIAGKNYFFGQYLKWGSLRASADIISVNEVDGKRHVLECNEAR